LFSTQSGAAALERAGRQAGDTSISMEGVWFLTHVNAGTVNPPPAVRARRLSSPRSMEGGLLPPRPAAYLATRTHAPHARGGRRTHEGLRAPACHPSQEDCAACLLPLAANAALRVPTGLRCTADAAPLRSARIFFIINLIRASPLRAWYGGSRHKRAFARSSAWLAWRASLSDGCAGNA